MTPDDTLARNRVLAMGLARVIGALLWLMGLLTVLERTDWPEWSGWLALGAGLVIFLFVPREMARRWRTPPE